MLSPSDSPICTASGPQAATLDELARGEIGAMPVLAPTPTLGRDVMLFFEDRDRDTFVRGDRRLRRSLRKAVALLRPNKQRVAGFEVSFILLCRALRLAGQRVHINDYALARRNPDFPVGLCGYTHVLDGWTLPNPAVLGPGLYDHPKQNPTLMQDPRFRSYLMFCDWMRDMFATGYERERLRPWFGGIDVAEWRDTKNLAKDVDVLVYDKIRWNRGRLVPSFRDPILEALSARKLRYEVLRYGRYTHSGYRRLLARSRSMLFLCENETQGMAYQEALACNVPVLAWDQGFWLDPNRELWDPNPVSATSVPYFSPECGERFVGLDDFAPTLERFLSGLDRYEPRRFVGDHLSLAESGELYLRAYLSAARKPLLSTIEADASLLGAAVHSAPFSTV
jgi:hypothetical protein